VKSGTDLAETMSEIAALCVRFASEVDKRNWAAVADCFTPDGTLETVLPPAVMHGRAEIEQSLRASAVPGLSAQHLVANHSYELKGEGATGHTSFTMFRWESGETPPPAVPYGGVYNDVLRRTDNGWRIAERRITILWSGIRA
jgi:ketosteroid isomerase-like protein